MVWGLGGEGGRQYAMTTRALLPQPAFLDLCFRKHAGAASRTLRETNVESEKGPFKEDSNPLRGSFQVPRYLSKVYLRDFADLLSLARIRRCKKDLEA